MDMYQVLITNWALQSYHIERSVLWQVFQVLFSQEKDIIKRMSMSEGVYFWLLTLTALAKFSF